MEHFTDKIKSLYDKNRILFTLTSSLLLCFLMPALSPFITDNAIADAIIGDGLSGAAAWWLAAALFPRHRGGFIRSFSYSSPAAAFAVANIIFASGAGVITPGGVIITLATAFKEEMVFRRFLIPALGGDKAPVVSALLFALAHLVNLSSFTMSNTLFTLGYTFIIGFVFGLAYYRSNNAAGCVFWHFVINLSALL